MIQYIDFALLASQTQPVVQFSVALVTAVLILLAVHILTEK